MNKELELIDMVLNVQSEQKEYWKQKRLYGNASQQLEKCKQLEKELNAYCNQRKKELIQDPTSSPAEPIQPTLFS